MTLTRFEFILTGAVLFIGGFAGTALLCARIGGGA